MGLTLGLSVCEDIWNDKRFWDRPRYERDPIADLVAGGAELVLNVSASPYALGKAALRERMLGAAARSHGAPIAYVNQVGGNDSLVFDGGSMLVGPTAASWPGRPSSRRRSWWSISTGAGSACSPGRPGAAPPSPPDATPDGQADEVFRALVLGVRDYVWKCGFRSAVIGLSGGIDSALTAAVAAVALGPDRVTGVAMPSRYSSDHSREDARILAERLGIAFREVPIEPMHAACLARLSAQPSATPPGDLTEQNVQARVRGQILMALSNETGALLLSTGNKSELAVGLLHALRRHGRRPGGDRRPARRRSSTGFRARRTGRWSGKRSRSGPSRSRPRPSSSPTRSTRTRCRRTTCSTTSWRRTSRSASRSATSSGAGTPRSWCGGCIRMVNGSEYKRRQAAPVLKVTGKAFGEGRRLPIAHGWRP